MAMSGSRLSFAFSDIPSAANEKTLIEPDGKKGGSPMKDKKYSDPKKNNDKNKKRPERSAADSCGCFYVVDACGCRVVDPCGCYVSSCCC